MVLPQARTSTSELTGKAGPYRGNVRGGGLCALRDLLSYLIYLILSYPIQSDCLFSRVLQEMAIDGDAMLKLLVASRFAFGYWFRACLCSLASHLVAHAIGYPSIFAVCMLLCCTLSRSFPVKVRAFQLSMAVNPSTNVKQAACHTVNDILVAA